MSGHIFVLAGPSGVGKNTVLKSILQNHPEFYRPVNLTSRAPRPEEVEGTDYFFDTPPEEFENKFETGELLEHVEFAGELYGTLKEQLSQPLEKGKTVCTLVEVDGALKIRKAFPDQTTLIFITAPDTEALKERLQHRHTESPEQVQKRLARVDYEINIGKKEFDFLVVNPDGHPEKAVAEIEKIITHATN